jgi:chromosome segregation ATPase
MDKLNEKLDSIEREVVEIKLILVKQEENIRHHIRRTDLAEENLKELREQIRPIEKHVQHVEGALKLLGGISVFVAFVVAILEIIKFAK